MKGVVEVGIDISIGMWSKHLCDEIRALDPERRAEYLRQLLIAGYIGKLIGDQVGRHLAEGGGESSDLAIVEAFFPELMPEDSCGNRS